MGLGGMLLNPAAAARRLRPPARPAEETSPAAPAAAAAGGASTPATTAQPGSGAAGTDALNKEFETAEIVILWPALGCPGLVSEKTPKLEVVFIAKEGPDAFSDPSGSHLPDKVLGLFSKVQVLEWGEARKPYNEDDTPWSPTQITTLDNLLKNGESDIRFTRAPQALDDYATGQPVRFGKILHNVAKVVPRVYGKKNFLSIIGVELTLTPASTNLQAGTMYTLYYPPENGLLREILGDNKEDPVLAKPYDDIPLMVYLGHDDEIGGAHQVYRARGRKGSRENRQNLVRLFHPFRMLAAKQSDYLVIGHVTDPHTSTLWDYLDRLIFPEHARDNPQINDGKRILSYAAKELRSPEKKHIPKQFNNPNLNLRDLTQKLKNQVDVILQTGDLIDFNRGFNHDPRHRLDRDYVFNLNWIRYYELLLLDYERPTYTSLGNHDWRLNPYPPNTKLQWSHYLLLLALLVPPTALAGAIGGLVWSESKSGGLSRQILNTLIFTWLAWVLIILLAASALFGQDVFQSDKAYLIFPGALLYSVLLGGGLKGWEALWGMPQDGQESALRGFVMGGAIGLVVLAVVRFWLSGGPRMDGITNLVKESDLDDLIGGHDVRDLNIFGPDKSLYMDESAFDWYALVINPFLDYAFAHGNVSIMMIDWGGQEILTSSPRAADAFSDRQWQLIADWLPGWAADRRKELAKLGGKGQLRNLVSILGLHSPVFCPEKDVNLRDLHGQGASVDDDNLKRGIMTRHREDLIKLLYKLGSSSEPGIPRPCPVYSLAGHTHVYDIFYHYAEDKVIWFQTPDHPKPKAFDRLNIAPLSGDEGLHMTTASTGPPASGARADKAPAARQQVVKKELEKLESEQKNIWTKPDFDDPFELGHRVARPPGCRVLRFDRDGKLTGIEEVSSTTAKWGGV